MKKIGRNDLCPCGSGKKFKKCHMGNEDELKLESLNGISDEMSSWITGLPEVSYGRSREIADNLDIKELTGNIIGIKFVDLYEYSELNLFGSSHIKSTEKKGGGIFINVYKTIKTDPDNIYLAISKNIVDSTLIHELAHVLDYLGGSRLMPGSMEPLAMELNLPIDHLEHPEEFACWLDYLATRFDVQLDADDTIISYLYKNKKLIRGDEIQNRVSLTIKSKSEEIFRFLSQHSKDIDSLIRNLPGYIGDRNQIE